MLRRCLRIRVNPVDASSGVAFELEVVDGESVGQLKARVSARVGPHPSFFVLRAGGRPLELVEPIGVLVSDEGATLDVAWNTCSHGAPAHPITGESPCFWDGGEPPSVVEY